MKKSFVLGLTVLILSMGLMFVGCSDDDGDDDQVTINIVNNSGKDITRVVAKERGTDRYDRTITTPNGQTFSDKITGLGFAGGDDTILWIGVYNQTEELGGISVSPSKGSTVNLKLTESGLANN